MFRITQRTLADTTYANLQASLSRSSTLQEQLSSGKQISRPSDNPIGASDIMQLKAERASTAQYVRNAENGISWLDTADNALQQTSTAIGRARALTVNAGNAALGQQGRDAIAAELTGLRANLLELANTQYLGRPVFGGTTGGPKAFEEVGDPGVVTYVGSLEGTVDRRVGAESTVRVDVDGQTSFGTIFADLDAIIADLQTGQPVDGRLAELDASLAQVLGALSDVGARTNRLENLKLKAEDAAITLRSSQSQIEDVDLPKTIMELQLQSTAYQAALGATARVLQPTLLDFLR